MSVASAYPWNLFVASAYPWKLLVSSAYPWKLLVASAYPWKSFVDSVDMESVFRSKSVPQIRISIERVLASRCLAMDYSGFQASYHNTVWRGAY
jgi:hypothetical protein